MVLVPATMELPAKNLVDPANRRLQTVVIRE
jgi:hypothetical protein